MGIKVCWNKVTGLYLWKKSSYSGTVQTFKRHTEIPWLAVKCLQASYRLCYLMLQENINLLDNMLDYETNDLKCNWDYCILYIVILQIFVEWELVFTLMGLAPPTPSELHLTDEVGVWVAVRCDPVPLMRSFGVQDPTVPLWRTFCPVTANNIDFNVAITQYCGILFLIHLVTTAYLI